MKTLRYFLCAALMMAGAVCQAQEDAWEKWGPTDKKDNVGFLVRAGYTIGGTTPLPLPNEIRAIKGFSPKGGATIGADLYKMYSKRWGVSFGCHFFYEGFNTTAEVKNYYMSLERDGDVMTGYFTGTDVTNTSMWGVTLPLTAVFRLSPRWSVALGPYVSAYFAKSFKGIVYENSAGIGYLREGTPTGTYVEITSDIETTYDFSDDMREWNAGLELCFDWKATRHFNVFGKVDWGISNIWDKSFKTVTFPMYPIYATVGMAYRY